MAAAASVALRRLASGPASQNAARIRRIVIIRASFVMTADMCCLARKSAKGNGRQGSDGQRARAPKVR
eukprot:3338184-Pleurochrysis_carterae.AAC.1